MYLCQWHKTSVLMRDDIRQYFVALSLKNFTLNLAWNALASVGSGTLILTSVECDIIAFHAINSDCEVFKQDGEAYWKKSVKFGVQNNALSCVSHGMMHSQYHKSLLH